MSKSLLDELFKRKNESSPTGNCWVFEDGLDGYVIHAPECKDVGYSWTNSTQCIGLRIWEGIKPYWDKH